MTDAILNDFRNFLSTGKTKLNFEEADFAANLDFIKRQIKYEYFLAHVGQEDAQKVYLEGDVQILKALEVLPQAKALFQNAKKSVASKGSVSK